jgi:hypothetical protein
MTTPVSNIPISLDYTSRDFYALREELITRLAERVPEWKGTDPADFGVALVEAFAYMGDIVNYYVDRVANENFILTATQRQSILELAATLGYVPTGYRAATTSLTLTNSSLSSVVLPADTQFLIDVICEDEVKQLIFSTASSVTIGAATAATTSAVASSTTVATYTVGTVSTVNPYVVGQSITAAGFSAQTYFNGTWTITAIGGSSGAWTATVVGSGFTVASATVKGTITGVTSGTVNALHGEWARSRVENAAIDDNDVSAEWVGTSNGLPNQVFQLLENQVVEGTVIVYVKNGDVYEKWSPTTSISEANPNEAVYYVTMDADNFVYINFGDGISGAIPANGETIKVDYLIGDSSLAREQLGWRPTKSFEDLIEDMCSNVLGDKK